jgi:RHS repeat-associated protein
MATVAVEHLENRWLPASVFFGTSSYAVNETAGKVTLTIQTDSPPPGTLTVNYSTSDGSAVAGSDYTAKSGTLTFTPFITSRTIEIFITDDEANEGNETLTVTLSNVNGGSLGTPATTTITINNATPTQFADNAYQRQTDPGQGTWMPFGSAWVAPQNGDLLIQQEIDYRRSLPSAQDAWSQVPGSPALVYHSMAASNRPLIEATYEENSLTSAAGYQVRLTWNNGTPQSWVSFSPVGGINPTQAFALQVDSPVTTSGHYTWKVEIIASYSDRGDVRRETSGTADVVAQGDSPFGVGWSLAGLDRLLPDSGGVLWLYGAGGSRYFTGTGGTYTSPANDFGTLVKNRSGSYVYTAKNQTQWNFDSTGRLTSIVDRHNLTRTFTYSGDHLVSVTEPDGGVTTFSYTNGHLTSILQPGGRTTSVTIDGSGNLTNLTNPDGSLRSFSYDTNHHLTGDQLGVSMTVFTYDATSGLLSGINRGGGTTLSVVPVASRGLQATQLADSLAATLTDALGHTRTLTLDTAGRLITQQQDVIVSGTYPEVWVRNSAGLVISHQDSLNRTTTFTYTTGTDDLTRIDHPDGSNEQFTYDSTFHNLTQYQDTLGHSTTLGYSSTGDLTSVQNALGQVTTFNWANGLLSSVQNARGYTTYFSYDTARRLETTTNALNQQTTQGYDAAGNVAWTRDRLNRLTFYTWDGLRRLVTVNDAAGGTQAYSYDARGLLLTDTDQNNVTTGYTYDVRGLLTARTDALGTSIQRTISYGYDAVGRMVSTTDALNHTVSYAYDARNQLVSVTDALNHQTNYFYDAAGQLIAETNPLGLTTHYGYNNRGWQTQIQDAQNNFTYFTYDTAGNLTSRQNARGYTTTYVYDSLHRLVQTTDALNHTTSQSYDANGNLLTRTDALGNVTNFTYDELDRRIFMSDALNHRTAFNYDAMDNLDSVSDPLFHVTSFAYDALDRRTRESTAFGTTAYGYDAVGNLLSLTDAQGNVTSFTYDALGRRVTEIDPLSHTITFGYDAANRLTSRIDRLGRRIDYSYDNADRLTATVWKDSGGITVNTLNYSYDAADELLTAGDQHGTYTFTYDALGQVASQQDIWNLGLTFSYDAVGNVTQVTDSLGGVTTSTYNAVDLLESRRFGGSGQTPLRIDFTYTARNERATDQRYSDLNATTLVGSTAYQYDIVGRLSSLQHRNSSNTLVGDYGFTYDAADRLTSETFNGTTTNYTYDNLDQLTSDGTQSYTYDAVGNRTNAGYVTGAGNQLLSDGVWTYTYDAEGNLIQKSRGAKAETWTYGYDHRNQMLWAEQRDKPGGNVLLRADYTYDVFGNRITKAVDDDGEGPDGTTTTRFAYAGSDIWADLNSSGQLQTRYFRGDVTDKLFARIQANGTAAWYLIDRQGSIRQMTDATGAVQDTITYDAWGNVLTETNASFGDRWKWTGREADSETGLQYNRWRYYSPGTGRWTTSDPLGFDAGDANLYRYVGNATLNATDPSGLVQESPGAPPGFFQRVIIEGNGRRSPKGESPITDAELCYPLRKPRLPGKQGQKPKPSHWSLKPVVISPYPPYVVIVPCPVKPLEFMSRRGVQPSILNPELDREKKDNTKPELSPQKRNDDKNKPSNWWVFPGIINLLPPGLGIIYYAIPSSPFIDPSFNGPSTRPFRPVDSRGREYGPPQKKDKDKPGKLPDGPTFYPTLPYWKFTDEPQQPFLAELGSLVCKALAR